MYYRKVVIADSGIMDDSIAMVGSTSIFGERS